MSDDNGTVNDADQDMKSGVMLTEAYVEKVRAEARLEAADLMVDEWTLNGAEYGLDDD